jgi:hypothetical protein
VLEKRRDDNGDLAQILADLPNASSRKKVQTTIAQGVPEDPSEIIAALAVKLKNDFGRFLAWIKGSILTIV